MRNSSCVYYVHVCGWYVCMCVYVTFYHFMQLKQHMDNLVSQLKSTSPESIVKLRQAAWKKFGDDHPVIFDTG